MTYHISPWRLWFTSGFFLVLALGLLLLRAAGDAGDSGDTGFRFALLVTALALAGFAAMAFALVWYTRLDLAPDVIRLRQIGYTLETDWSNLARLDETAGAQGLVLHRPMACRGARVLRTFRGVRVGRMRMYGDDQAAWIGERRFVPIEAFAYWLEKGGLREELRRRGPGLATR
jgi:hypothetical protein